jgi:hypothetical protein
VILIVARIDHTHIEAAERTIDTIRAISRVEPLLVIVGEKADRTDYYEYAGRFDEPRRRPVKQRS